MNSYIECELEKDFDKMESRNVSRRSKKKSAEFTFEVREVREMTEDEFESFAELFFSWMKRDFEKELVPDRQE